MKRNRQLVWSKGADAALDETTRTLIALVEAVDQRDGHVAGHSERLAYLGVTLGIALGLEGESLQQLYRGGYLHDIGKIGIPDAILLKPDKLTAEEWETMRSHPTRGEEICRHLHFLAPVLPLIRHHHERFDGTGYPDGLRGEKIPLLARILQVADIYDALTHPRPYKPAYSGQRALAILQAETDRGWRDPQVVQMFLRLHEGVIASSPDGELSGADRSLSNLRRFLGTCAGNGSNGRISFRPLPPAPGAGSRAEAKGR